MITQNVNILLTTLVTASKINNLLTFNSDITALKLSSKQLSNISAQREEQIPPRKEIN